MQRPRRRRGPPTGKLVRVQLRAGGDKFPLTAHTVGGIDQGNMCVLGLSAVMPKMDDSPQDIFHADARLTSLTVIFPPIGNAEPSGFDILIRGPPNMPRLGAVVGRTAHYLSRVNTTTLRCRLPAAVTQMYINDPEKSPLQIVLQQRIAVQNASGQPSTSDFPPFILELRFTPQPIETVVL